MNIIPIDVNRLRSLLNYDADTGIVTRKIKTPTRMNCGDAVGQTTRKGYLQAKVDGRSMLVHRIAYAIYHGVDPSGMLIDHIDGDRSNNRILNLRLCTNSQNLMNRRGVPSHSTTGLRGVHYSKKERKYIAHLKVDGKLRRLASVDDPMIAASIAASARRAFYGEFCGADI